MKHLLVHAARYWLQKPENQEKIKRAVRTAWQSYQDSQRTHESEGQATTRTDRSTSSPRSNTAGSHRRG